MWADPRHQGRPWGDVAPFLETGLLGWAATHGYQVREGESLWERYRESIRHPWERVSHRSRQRIPSVGQSFRNTKRIPFLDVFIAAPQTVGRYRWSMEDLGGSGATERHRTIANKKGECLFVIL